MTSNTMTAPTPLAVSTPRRQASFWNILSSEWSKMASLRATHITLALGLFLSIGTTALAAFAFGASNAEWPEKFDPILFSMVGNVFALITYSVFGVLAVSREYTSGMMRLTLTATPNRGQVLLAKLVLVGGIMLVFGIITTLGMFLVGQAVLGAYGFPTATLNDGDARWVVFGLGATMPFFPLMGLAIGVLLRSTAGAITTVLAVLWLPQIFSEFISSWLQENVISLLPGSALDSSTLGNVVESPSYTDPLVGAFVAAAWLVAIIGAAYVTLVRRDA